MEIKILIADDHKIVRQGLKTLIEKNKKSWSVVAEASNGKEAIGLAEKLRPDIVVMDISMPELNGIEATRQLTSLLPNTRVIALSMHSERRFVIEALKAGASGYLLKDSAFEELLEAITTVFSGKSFLSTSIVDVVIRDYVTRADPSETSAFTLLTAREREVLQLISEGKTTKDIAHLIKVSVKTVETYRQQLMDKLNIRSVAELTKFAIREGLTKL